VKAEREASSKRQAKWKAAHPEKKGKSNAVSNGVSNAIGNGVNNGLVTGAPIPLTLPKGNGAGAPAFNVDAAIAELNAEGTKNPNAIVAKLFVARYGETYKPNFGRIGKLAGQVSGHHVALCRLIWENSIPVGDPHDYLTRVIAGSKAQHRDQEAATRVDKVVT
jgi:hypothetical protein